MIQNNIGRFHTDLNKAMLALDEVREWIFWDEHVSSVIPQEVKDKIEECKRLHQEMIQILSTPAQTTQA